MKEVEVDINPNVPFIENPIEPLCNSCDWNPLDCKNETVRDIRLPLEADDEPVLEIMELRRQPNGKFLPFPTGEKWVDVLECGRTDLMQLPSIFCTYYSRRRTPRKGN